MRKIAISALGVLVSVLASPTAVGQVPKIKIPVKIQSDAQMEVGFQRLLKSLEKDAVLNVDARVRVNQLRGALLRQHNIVFRVNGTIVRQGPEAEPLMQGDLKATVEEIQKVLRAVRVGDLAQALAALDVVQRGTMRARRLLRTQKDLVEKPSEDEVRALTQMQYFSAFLRQSDPTPLEEAHSALKQAVVSVRKATDLEEAKKALDDVEESLAALRILLWEKKSFKKD